MGGGETTIMDATTMDAPLPILFGLLAAIAWIDARTQRIPDALNLALGATGLAFVALADPTVLPAQVALAIALAALFWSVRAIHARLTGRIGLGLGDVKFAGAAGCWLAVDQVPLFLLASTGTALVFALPLALAGRARQRVPFGPFLCLGVILCRFA